MKNMTFKNSITGSTQSRLKEECIFKILLKKFFMILKNEQYKHLSKDCVAQDTKELLSDI